MFVLRASRVPRIVLSMLLTPTVNIRSSRKKSQECLMRRMKWNVRSHVTLSYFQLSLRTTSSTNIHYLKIIFAQIHRGRHLGAEQTKWKALKNSYSSAILAQTEIIYKLRLQTRQNNSCCKKLWLLMTFICLTLLSWI